MPSIGENIKAARIRKGLTQQDLANALNTTKSAISRYELGKREPRYKLLMEISGILEVSCSDLIGDEKIELELRRSDLKERINEALEECVDLDKNLDNEMAMYFGMLNYDGKQIALDYVAHLVGSKKYPR